MGGDQNAHQERLEEQLSALSDQRAELTKILTTTDVKSKTQWMDDGARVTQSYWAAEGMVAVTTEGLPVLPSDKGYELWLISDTGAVSAGKITVTKTDGMVMVSGPMEGVTHFGITVEPASGSPTPTTDPIMVQARCPGLASGGFQVRVPTKIHEKQGDSGVQAGETPDSFDEIVFWFVAEISSCANQAANESPRSIYLGQHSRYRKSQIARETS